MKLLDGTAIVPDPWVRVEGAEPVLPDGPAIVDIAALEAGILSRAPHAIGVALPHDREPADLKPWLGDLALVSLTLPIFRDGRAFTQARALREYHGYGGIIRAEGHIIPDQYAFLRRCGVDVVAVADDADADVWIAALTRFHVAYQHAQKDGAPAGPGLKRFLRLG